MMTAAAVLTQTADADAGGIAICLTAVTTPATTAAEAESCPETIFGGL